MKHFSAFYKAWWPGGMTKKQAESTCRLQASQSDEGQREREREAVSHNEVE